MPVHRALGLTDGELERIVSLLEREPNHFELAVFSLLWSEHCGYKHSALLLKRLPSTGKRVLQGPGENAGVLDLGEGEAVCFKVESHNHPSAVEPFQGAATGVGGILRDIIAMGARPIALLDGLRFAPGDWRFSSAVAGIGHYGNCLAADERIVYRNSGRVRDTTIGELAEGRVDARDAQAWDAVPVKAFQVLSFDPETGEAVWKDVCRIFKRQADGLLKFKTALGRSLTVTPDHPVMLWRDNQLVQQAAKRVRVGDRLPLLASLPQASADDLSVDLIAEVADPDSIVLLPSDWVPSAQLRVALRDVIPRADARHFRLSRRELPLSAFHGVEGLVGVPRQALRLRLPGPRSTPVPAVLRLDGDVARLLGYYIAEGCCSANGTTTKIIWTFGRNERDRTYVEDVCRILGDLGIRHSVAQRRSSVAITVSSRLLGRAFEQVLEIGCRSFEKRIPSYLMQASTQLRREVLTGIFRGDGSFDFPRKGSAVRVRHSTTSLELHHQLLLLLQSFGIFASRYDWRPAGDLPGRRKYASRQAYALEFFGAEAIEEAATWFLPADAETMLKAARHTANSPFARPRAKRHGGLASVAVLSVEEIEGKASVYDFEVPGTHLFATTGGIVTHNCVGVPTVGGEAVFDEAYRDNVLVNAMCVGLLPADRVTRAGATGPGNLVVLYGATTGRDGIGGASVLASQELGEDDADKRPTVQVGDPFMGKKLIEVSVELVEAGLVESLQDCGAAGLASSLSEMARECGIDLRLDQVPLREAAMEPWEVMISESQERMVAVVRPQMLERVLALCERWELHHAVIGEVTDTGLLRALWEDEVVGEIPARLLTDECPRYRVEPEPRETPGVSEPQGSLDAPAHPQALLELLASENLRSRRPVYQQYDHLVGSRTVRRPGLDAAVLRLRPGYRGLAVSLDGTGRMGRLSPRTGGQLAVLEAARNVACTGAEPLGLTDCLNFGNPEKGAIAWELVESIEGMAEACEALRIPIVSGNVSLYNETDGRAIDPTPVVGCVGLLPDVRKVPRGWREGDVVLLAGASPVALAGSEYQARYGEVGGHPARLDLAAEAAFVEFLWRAAPRCSLVHDVSLGGLAVALAKAALHSGIGAQVTLPDDPRAWFGEGGGQAVLACAAEDVEALGGVPLRRLGVVGGDAVLGIRLDALREAHS